MLDFTLVHPRASQEMLGLIPMFLSEFDPRPAREQFNEAYAHGGGWDPFQGFKLVANGISHPGDPVTPLIATAMLRGETINIYDSAWVAIIQPDGSYEISRMD